MVDHWALQIADVNLGASDFKQLVHFRQASRAVATMINRPLPLMFAWTQSRHRIRSVNAQSLSFRPDLTPVACAHLRPSPVRSLINSPPMRGAQRPRDKVSATATVP
jgi:hypothetical protein